MKNKIIKGTLIMSAAGILTRIIGFYNRIFLAGTIGAEGVGLYQMIFPIYGLCISFAVSGIQIAISKYVAEQMAKNSPKQAYHVLWSGLKISFILSLLASLVLYNFRFLIAEKMIGDVRCAALLQLTAFAVPICVIHGCIFGYFMGKSAATVPAVAQLMEQIFRVGIVYLIAVFYHEDGYLSPSTAMFGVVAGEFVSSVICIFALFFDIKKTASAAKKLQHAVNKKILINTHYTKKIWKLSYPLASGRVLTSLILSSEAVLMLRGLKIYGMTHADAITVYGILTGMAMPFIFFPSTVTSSIAAMLLPSVSEAQSNGNYVKIAKTTTLVVKYCFAIGIFFSALFYYYGYPVGVFFFHNETAGTFISILSWICPFMYLGSTLSSILNGLGKTKITSIVNVGTALSRVGALCVFVPVYGVKGYLWGILISQLFSAGVFLFFVKKFTHFRYHVQECLVLPCIVTIFSLAPALITESLLNLLSVSGMISVGISGGMACALFCAILGYQIKSVKS